MWACVLCMPVEVRGQLSGVNSLSTFAWVPGTELRLMWQVPGAAEASQWPSLCCFFFFSCNLLMCWVWWIFWCFHTSACLEIANVYFRFLHLMLSGVRRQAFKFLPSCVIFFWSCLKLLLGCYKWSWMFSSWFLGKIVSYCLFLKHLQKLNRKTTQGY